MINYFNYFTEVEEHFARLRGKNLLVSPLDWCLIELWRDSGIPLHVTLRGIDRSFEAAQRTQKKPPGNLSYCHSAILEAFEEYNRAMLGPVDAASQDESPGKQEAEFSRERVIAHLRQLEKRMRQHTDEVFQRTADRVGSLTLEISAGSRVDYQQVDLELSHIGSLLAESLSAKIGREQFEAFQQEVHKEMKIYKKRLSKEMYARLEQTYLERKIRAFFELPDFSLLGMEEHRL